MAQAQTLLIEQEDLAVHYIAYQSKSGKEEGEWSVRFEITNRGKVDLYYKVRVTEPRLDELIPSFLTVNVVNAADSYAGKLFRFHGTAPAIQASTDGTAIYKVKTKTYDKRITVRTNNGEEPRLTGEFTEVLLPLDQVKQLKLKSD